VRALGGWGRLALKVKTVVVHGINLQSSCGTN